MSGIEVAKPIEGDFDQEQLVALEHTASGKRFTVDRKALMTYSKLARDLLENASSDESIPLDNPHCTEESIALFATWINHHAHPDSIVTKITYPLAPGEPSSIFASWDLQFITEHLVPGGDMRNHKKLYLVAGVAVYLGVTILQELCCGYMAWHVRDATEKSKQSGAPTPTSVVRSWFGMDGDFEDAELRAIVQKFRWCRSVDYNQLEKESAEAHELVGADRRKAAA
mmetsp:Transcript_1146/g.3751  ORF Transcript_1146/g.3751 Transcript_1146/m.3751 type:complete len:227 (-) Transcript_1146:174-854(-)|eukprot:CAMPEP_0174830376 /NCGR_PEP_ID=MMETSP1114-20130205/2483_1 /TAXON_ID=312471 /ORGANISM="Neobodo designis, Strain CCAP 1951/1" /LENGTH=226 /DNA_ID=CAMNT_0016064171 /DNA_START=67 /DNA_END=747 /DNA_ORIENTATION=+